MVENGEKMDRKRFLQAIRLSPRSGTEKMGIRYAPTRSAHITTGARSHLIWSLEVPPTTTARAVALAIGGTAAHYAAEKSGDPAWPCAAICFARNSMPASRR